MEFPAIHLCHSRFLYIKTVLHKPKWSVSNSHLTRKCSLFKAPCSLLSSSSNQRLRPQLSYHIVVQLICQRNQAIVFKINLCFQGGNTINSGLFFGGLGVPFWKNKFQNGSFFRPRLSEPGAAPLNCLSERIPRSLLQGALISWRAAGRFFTRKIVNLFDNKGLQARVGTGF